MNLASPLPLQVNLKNQHKIGFYFLVIMVIWIHLYLLSNDQFISKIVFIFQYIWQTFMWNVEQINKRLFFSNLEQTIAYTLSCNIVILIRTLGNIWTSLLILHFVGQFMNSILRVLWIYLLLWEDMWSWWVAWEVWFCATFSYSASKCVYLSLKLSFYHRKINSKDYNNITNKYSIYLLLKYSLHRFYLKL
jgi:hypothetical protein